MSRFLNVIFIPILSIFLFQGCSFIGFSASLYVEEIKNREYESPVCKLYELQKGQNIQLILTSNDTLKAHFLKLQRVSMQRYKEKYSIARRLHKLEGLIPYPGEMIYLGDDTTSSYHFIAFEFQQIIFGYINKKGIVLYDLYEITSLNNVQKRSYDLNMIMNLMLQNQIPFITELKVRVNKEEVQIPIEKVVFLKLLDSQAQPCVGGLMGLLIDILILNALFGLKNPY